jgi:hypothetical protein
MPKEPSIFRMDWRGLGYIPVWQDGKLRWIKDTTGDNPNLQYPAK